MKTTPMMRSLTLAAVLLLAACGGGEQAERDGELQLLNVSYDPTRELYREFNERFVAKWLTDWMLSMSQASASVTTSAFNPSMTARA